MRASENAELVRKGYDRWIAGDLDGLLALFAEDAEWIYPPGTPFSGHCRGRAQVREFFETLDRLARLDNLTLKETIAEGERVAVLGESRLASRESGRHAEVRWAHLFTLREGKAARVEVFEDTRAVASIFGESAAERRAQLGPMGVTHPPFSGYGDDR